MPGWSNPEDKKAWYRAYYASPAYKERLKRYKEARKADPDYHVKHACRRITSNAVKSGRITKLPCQECGKETSQAHHEDYAKPLEVTWLCRKCHEDWHKENQPTVPAELKRERAPKPPKPPKPAKVRRTVKPPKPKPQPVTHCPNGHEYTAGNTYLAPDGWRRCRRCNADRVRRFKQKRRG